MKRAFFNYTGYGKTKIVLDFIKSTPSIKRVLIISKGDIIKQSWPNEITKWQFPFTYTYIDGTVSQKEKLKRVYGMYDITGITPAMLGWFTENKFYNLTKKQIKYDLVVFDESDLFKNSQTKRFKNVKKWIANVPNVFILTATPMPNTLEDLWSQIYLIDEPPYKLGKNITAFRKTYGEEVRNGDRFEYFYLPAAVKAVMSKIAPMCEVNLVKPKGVYPAPKIRIVRIKPDETTRIALQKLEKDYVLLIENEIIAAKNQNMAIMKLQQLSSGFIYDDNKNPIYLNDIKLRYVQKIMRETLDPVLVTYAFIHDKEKLLNLKGASIITDENDWNQNKIKLGIMYMNTAGLNLQHSRCRNIIWFSPTWDARAWEQTNARVIRRGLLHQVTIDVLVIEGSMDDHIYKRMKEKERFMYTTFKPLEGGSNKGGNII